MADADLSPDDNTLLTAREGMPQTYKNIQSIYFEEFSVTMLVDVFSPII